MLELKAKLKIETQSDHRYTVDGFQAPSVTGVLRTAVTQTFYGNEAAMFFGSRVHAAVHYDLLNDLNEETIDDDVMGCVLAARKFMKDHCLKPLLVEEPIGSLNPLCAGREDLLAVDESDALDLIDWKTGAELPITLIQLAGYQHLIGCTFGLKKIKRMAVYLNRDGTYGRPEIYTDPNHLEVFLAAHRIWNWKNKNKE